MKCYFAYAWWTIPSVWIRSSYNLVVNRKKVIWIYNRPGPHLLKLLPHFENPNFYWILENVGNREDDYSITERYLPKYYYISNDESIAMKLFVNGGGFFSVLSMTYSERIFPQQEMELIYYSKFYSNPPNFSYKYA